MDPHVVQERAGADAAAGVLEIGQMGARLSVAEADLEVVRDEYLDVPVLRWVCTKLAMSMVRRDWPDEPAVMHWVENASKDPLPEVRGVAGDFNQGAQAVQALID